MWPQSGEWVGAVSWGTKLAFGYLIFFTCEWFTEAIWQKTGFGCVLVIKGCQEWLAEVTWQKERLKSILRWIGLNSSLSQVFLGLGRSIGSMAWGHGKPRCMVKTLRLHQVLFRFFSCQHGAEQWQLWSLHARRMSPREDRTLEALGAWLLG